MRSKRINTANPIRAYQKIRTLNKISLLNSHPSPTHRKYERFANTIRIVLEYLSTSSGRHIFVAEHRSIMSIQIEEFSKYFYFELLYKPNRKIKRLYALYVIELVVDAFNAFRHHMF